MFSISDLEQLSGISSHTIRIWERRYNALEPARSSGNTRLYDDDQLRRLLNIVSLVESGLKISNVGILSEVEIDRLLEKEMQKNISKNLNDEYYISQVIKHGFDYNEPGVSQLLSCYIQDHGMLAAYKRIIYPLLVRLGLMWRIDKICPSQEHFLTSIIRQKLFSAINDLPFKKEVKPSWLLFLPEDEDHDVGLLFANYFLRLNQHSVIYLGPKVPLESVKHAMARNNIDNLLLFMVKLRPLKETNEYLTTLVESFKQSGIYLAGNGKLLGAPNLNPAIKLLPTLDEFERIIKHVEDAN